MFLPQLLRRKGVANEVLGDAAIFPPGQQDADRMVDGPSCAADLLVVVDDRRRTLEVDHECEVWLIEAHPQRRRRDQRPDPVVEERHLPRPAIAI